MSDVRSEDRGEEMHRLLRELFPICRSITGDGLRQTLEHLRRVTEMNIHEVPSGTKVFDWTVPDEWNIREAWIENPSRKRIIDFANNNLHIVSYSVPIDCTMQLEDLQRHLHSLPDNPDWIPYKTSYYQEGWGFCLSHRLRESMGPGEYRVRIDSTKGPGSLTYGELYLPGELQEEVLISTHVCHPSLANDNLSGTVVANELARYLRSKPERRFSYRFLFVPGTIGAIVWLAQNQEAAQRVRYGLVLSGVGDPGSFTYKRSRRGDARIDRIASRVLAKCPVEDGTVPPKTVDFTPYGYDERQYCSPGFNLPMGTFSRSPYGTYPEYHTSADTPEFVRPDKLSRSLEVLQKILDEVEGELRTDEGVYWSCNPHCELQLGKRGLYGADGPGDAMAYLWVLNYSDGNQSLVDISERSGIPLKDLVAAAQTLLSKRLLRRFP